MRTSKVKVRWPDVIGFVVCIAVIGGLLWMVSEVLVERGVP